MIKKLFSLLFNRSSLKTIEKLKSDIDLLNKKVIELKTENTLLVRENKKLSNFVLGQIVTVNLLSKEVLQRLKPQGGGTLEYYTVPDSEIERVNKEYGKFHVKYEDI